MRYRLRTLLIAIVVFNAVSAYAFLQAEAIAVTRASNEHGHIADYHQRIVKMHEAMDAAWHHVHLGPIIAAWGAINVALCGISLAAFNSSRSK